MKYVRNFVRLISIVILGLAVKSVQAADFHLCWEISDGSDIAVIDLYFTSVAPGIYNVAGTSEDIGEPELGVVTGAAVVTGGKAIGHIGVNGSEFGADGLLYTGQFRFKLNLTTMVLTFEGIGTEYSRGSGEIFHEYDTGIATPIACPSL